MSSKAIWITIIIVFAILLVAGIVYWQITSTAEREANQLQKEQNAVNKLNNALKDATSLPDYGAATNPLEKMPDTNPLNKTNPFNGMKTNPFD